MDQSESALWHTDSLPDYYRRPVTQLLDDGSQYSAWENRHSLIMRHVADCSRPHDQVLELRRAAVKMIHRRGLVDYLRNFSVRGAAREDLIHAFYGPKDYREAVIAEHHQYIQAASSGYCMEKLTDTVQDVHGLQLLERYQILYRDYFGMYGQFLQSERTAEEEMMAALRPTMKEYRSYLDKLRAQIFTNSQRRQFFSRLAA
jgi:hypothetical protein